MFRKLAKDSAYYTRGFLTVRGEMAGEDVAVIVCHWPSRFSGPFYRESRVRARLRWSRIVCSV